MAVPEGRVLRGDAARFATPYQSGVADRRSGDRRTGGRRAGDSDSSTTTATPGAGTGSRPGPFRLGDVYAAELARLRQQAHAEGYAAGHAEGLEAAAAVVAGMERAAAARLAEAQARWDRRLASATAALGAAAAALENAVLPVADDIRDSLVGAALTLVEDLLGRELALADSPALDAVRRALTLCPADAPVVLRLHPDDLAELPDGALAGLPDSVTVVPDASIERAGAVAETGPRRIDAQLGAALERVQAVLSA
jgi:flagellar assembly protein FliH